MCNSSEEKFLIIHGHFYQPPRENPWTGIIDHQESAHPYHDWNERITRECYAANAASRILDIDGRISDIVNNYEYISFNIGPTLMNWIKDSAPHIYRRITDADIASRKMFGGYGNAIAQVYNHVILPLADREDRKTQILWGMEDFRSHFEREPEGIWLSETAINEDVIDDLVSSGIKFVILSPWQAEAVQNPVSREWINLNDKPAPNDRAFKITRPGGELAVFFYNPDLASGISFGHYLHSADNLMNRILDIFNNQEGNLINVATDGEIYGHHEPFGDMCLAALSDKIKKRDDIRFTNYSEYLSLFPPEQEVRLRPGEAGKGTSWSCSHGVSRWYKDCGCNTGSREGWNQKWRTPLREAFDYLNNNLREIFIEEMKGLTDNDPFVVRNAYIDVLTRKKTPQGFCVEHLKDHNPGTQEKILKLLEGQKYALYTFTSCGWFFSEVSGLEPVQNMKYAAKAIHLYKSHLAKEKSEQFLKILSGAVSNIKEQGNGKTAFLRYTKTPENLITDTAGIFLFMDRLHIPCGQYGIFRNQGITYKPSTNESEAARHGIIHLLDTEIAQTYRIGFNISESENKLFPVLEFVSPQNAKTLFRPEKLPVKIKNIIADSYPRIIDTTGISLLLSLVQQSLDIEYIKTIQNEFPETIMAETVSLFFNFSILCVLLNLKKKKDIEKNFLQLKELLSCCSIDHLWKKETINRLCQDILAGRIESFIETPDDSSFEFIMDLLKVIYKSGLDPVKPLIQEKIFEILKYPDKNPALFVSYGKEIRILADYFNINTYAF